jgi:hypothetical protein
MANFTRKPSVSRMKFLGMKLNAAPDVLQDGKFPYAQNVRGYLADQVTSRPPWISLTAAPSVDPGPVLSLEPALGIYKIGTAIYLSGTQLDTGYAASVGCSLIPFRPAQSPSAWEYVFDGSKQVKVLPNAVVPADSLIKKVGIAEPQFPCDAYFGPRYENLYGNFVPAASWQIDGSCAAVTDGQRINPSDTVLEVVPDPVFNTGPSQVATIQTANLAQQYQRGMQVVIPVPGVVYRILDVFPAATQSIEVTGVYYFAGSTGHCVISLQNLDAGPGNPGIGISTQQLLGSLRRGALVNFLSGGTTVAGACYIWSVTVGPDGSVCVETSTSATVSVGNTMTSVAAIQVGTQAGMPTIGQSIGSTYVSADVGTGIGSIVTSIVAFEPIFSQTNYAFQPDDYLHFSLQVDLPDNLVSIRIGLDISDGSFTRDYYYYEIRPSDLQDALTGNAATQILQIGAAQLVGQRAQIDSEQATGYNNEIYSSAGGQLLPGGGSPTWTEIVIPISKMTRVGSDQTKTIANAGTISIAANVSTGPVQVAFGSFAVYGGGQPDTTALTPYQYRYRQRDSTTGAASNWSPVTRYGVSPERNQVSIIIPEQTTDPQSDTYDIERMGGALEDFTYIGSTLIVQPSSSNATPFTDNYGDEDVAENDQLPEDNYEPFPSIGPPLSTTATGATLVGYVAILRFSTATPNATLSQFGNLLPGNEIQVGQQVYTTFKRPTLISNTGGIATYSVHLNENAGAITGVQAIISEPALANQTLGQVWGPDDNGCLFAVGDKLRPGGIYNTNPQNPDGCNEGVNFNELCAPTEPLINGDLIQQTSCVASPKRWWAGRSGQDALGNLKYSFVEIPVGRGLAATYGICTDGNNIYFVGPDGIYSHSGGPAQSLTDEDLYPLFPHEGLIPQNIVTNSGQTVHAPNYLYTNEMRLSTANGYLYFDYLDYALVPHTMVMNLQTRAWSVDTFAIGSGFLTLHASTIAPISPADGTLTSQVYAADSTGAIYVTEQAPYIPGDGEIVPCLLETRDETGDDVRASKLFGDAMADTLPASAITVTPLLFGVAQAPTVIPAGASRVPAVPIDVGGEALAQTFGLLFSWSDQGVQSILFAWQVSWVPQPENTAGRYTDWDGGPNGRNLFFQGFELEADTGNTVKGLRVRDADQLALHSFNGPTGLTNQVKHNGQQVLPYSFVTPFQAHLVRLEPTDAVIWRMYRVRWITRPTPDSALNWGCQPTGYEIPGYHHVHHSLFAYSSSEPVTLSIQTDTNGALTYVLPSTGGAYKKVLVMFQAIKGLVDIWAAASAAAFQVWTDDIEIFVKGWGDPGPYTKARLLGAPMTPDADI